MLVEKSSHLPPVGSLKEALFLTVWLKRSEADALRTRMLAQGLLDIAGEKASKDLGDLYSSYLSSAMPFLSKAKVDKDAELKKVMEREMKKGVIAFNVSTPNPLVQRAKAMSLPDDFRQKLADRRRRNA